jgi:hypothetical protein
MASEKSISADPSRACSGYGAAGVSIQDLSRYWKPLKANFVPDSWEEEESESEVITKSEILATPNPKEQIKIIIEKYPNLMKEIRKSDKSPGDFIDDIIFNMEGYLKPVPSNALKDAKKKYIELHNTYSILFLKKKGGLDGYLENPNKIDDQTLRPLYEVREEIWIIEQKIYWRDYVKDLIGLTTNTSHVNKRVIMDDLNFLMENSKLMIKKKKSLKLI